MPAAASPPSEDALSAEALWTAGYTSRGMIRETEAAELAKVPGLTPGFAAFILRELKDIHEEPGPTSVTTPDETGEVREVIIEYRARDDATKSFRDLGLSAEASNALFEAGFHTTESLRRAPRGDLLRVRSMDHDIIDRLFRRLGRTDTLPPPGPSVIDGIAQKAKSILAGFFGPKPAPPHPPPAKAVPSVTVEALPAGANAAVSTPAPADGPGANGEPPETAEANRPVATGTGPSPSPDHKSAVPADVVDALLSEIDGKS